MLGSKHVVLLLTLVLLFVGAMFVLVVPFVSKRIYSIQTSDAFTISDLSDLSKFTSPKWVCHGTCTCETELESSRRNSLARPLYFTVSAISLALALSTAKNHFYESCKLSIDDCPSNSIISEVETCMKADENVVRPSLETEELKDREEDFTSPYDVHSEGWKKEGYEREFACYGHCVANSRLARPEVCIARDNFRCEESYLEELILIDITSDIHSVIYNNRLAVKTFREEYLRPFCREISAIYYEYSYEFKDNNFRTVRKETHMCSHNRPALKLDEIDNVECKLYSTRYMGEFQKTIFPRFPKPN